MPGRFFASYTASMRRTSAERGVTLLSSARTIRYVGWGFGEPLIPVLLMSLTGSFSEAGLVRASYDVILLLALPVLGVLAERVSAKWLVVIGLLLYPIVGTSYFFAGATGIVGYVVLARVVNGVAWGFESTGMDAYIRRMAPDSRLASAFGFLDTASELGWILSALIGIVLVKFFSIHALLFLVVPTALLALIPVLSAKTDEVSTGRSVKRLHIRASYRAALQEWRIWDGDLRLLAMLLLFTETVTVLIDFFIPIDIYLESHDLTFVILFSVVAALPTVFGYLLGKFADHEKKGRLAGFACGGIAVILATISFPVPYALTILGGLVIGILIELISVVRQSLATTLSSEDHYGRLGAVFGVITGISDLAAPPILGVTLDMIGFPALSATLAAIALFIAIVLFFHTRPGAYSRLRHLNFFTPPPPEHAI